MSWWKWALWGICGIFVFAIGLFFLSYALDQYRFSQAANQCERDCIQDSGGLDSCREGCNNSGGVYGGGKSSNP